MNTRRRVLLSRTAAILACAVFAAILARFAVRTPALWPLAPQPLLHGLVAVFQPRGQEAVADVEWFGFWLVGFVVLLGSAGLCGWLLRRVRGRR